MNNRFNIKHTLVIASAVLLSNCSEDSPFDTSSASGTNEIPAVNDVITQIPDQNSLSLAFDKLAVEALNREGDTVIATVYVADRNNNPVPDNTAIRFETNGGHIEPQCLTEDGACTVTWTEHDPTPTTYKAIVIAYTTGEESFTDLNDNNMYDSGESFTDISEPYFDINENATRDPNTEGFIDADNDNVFDVADGLFTGTPCVGDNTVCNRTSTLIWTSGSIQLSGSYADNTSLSGSLPATINTTATVTVTVLDINGNPMADGTTVSISSSDGTVSPTTWSFAPLQSQFILQYTTGATAGIKETLTIEVTSPSGAITSTLFSTPTLN